MRAGRAATVVGPPKADEDDTRRAPPLKKAAGLGA
jgi:hypothetical protein